MNISQMVANARPDEVATVVQGVEALFEKNHLTRAEGVVAAGVLFAGQFPREMMALVLETIQLTMLTTYASGAGCTTVIDLKETLN